MSITTKEIKTDDHVESFDQLVKLSKVKQNIKRFNIVL